jgi:hypothetical protein
MSRGSNLSEHTEEGEMKARVVLCASVLLALVVSVAWAERPPEPRSKANLVVVGTIKKIATTENAWGGDGIATHYTADVAVSSVEKGKGAKVGETIKVRWYHVTKSPSKLLPGAYGKSYPIKAKDRARFWLMGNLKAGWTIIYNSNGVETLKK